MGIFLYISKKDQLGDFPYSAYPEYMEHNAKKLLKQQVRRQKTF